MNIRKINLRYSKWAIILAFITLPYFLLFTFTYLPFGEMVTYTFYKMKYIGERTFVGLKNYKDLFTRDNIFTSLKLSLYYMGGYCSACFSFTSGNTLWKVLHTGSKLRD